MGFRYPHVLAPLLLATRLALTTTSGACGRSPGDAPGDAGDVSTSAEDGGLPSDVSDTGTDMSESGSSTDSGAQDGRTFIPAPHGPLPAS
jgi:hypothetical protein